MVTSYYHQSQETNTISATNCLSWGLDILTRQLLVFSFANLLEIWLKYVLPMTETLANA